MSMSRLPVVFILLVGLTISCDGQRLFDVWQSSRENEELAMQRYPDDPVQRWVATKFGDEMQRMTNDLARRKESGTGAFERHLDAWLELDNWEFDTSVQEERIRRERDPHGASGASNVPVIPPTVDFKKLFPRRL
jgi:hypothetical protein